MTYQVRFRKEAERDIEDAAQWYETQSQGLGHNYLDQISEAVAKIAENPLQYPVVHKGIRRVLINKFPFGIYFRLMEDTVLIFAVLHASRDPNIWKQRPSFKH